jgi:hypothetical protein
MKTEVSTTNRKDKFHNLIYQTFYLVPHLSSPIPHWSTQSSYLFAQGSLIALMKEAVSTSETSVSIYLTTRQYIPEDTKLHCIWLFVVFL